MVKANKWFIGAFKVLAVAVCYRLLLNKFNHATAFGPQTFITGCKIRQSDGLLHEEVIQISTSDFGLKTVEATT
jgi:hypothetical protein